MSPRDPGEDLTHAILGPTEVEVFENLYAAYAAEARRTAYGVLHDEELAADAVHAAYIELFRHILSGARWNDPRAARAAVLRNANWAALKALRTRRRRPELPMLAGDAIADDSAWARSEARALCEQVVDRLPQRQAQLLHLRYVDGLSTAECATRLGIAADAFEKRLARAVRAARRAALGMGLVPAVLAGWSRHRPGAPPRWRGPLRNVVAAAAGTAAIAVTAQVATGATPRGDAMRVAPARPAPGTSQLALATLDDASIVDGVRLSGGVALLLGEGRRCACGVVFASRDAGAHWSAITGPAHVVDADRFVVTTTGSGIDVHVLVGGRSAWSAAALSAFADTGAGDVVVPRVVRAGPSSGGWVLALSPSRLLRVGLDRHAVCSSDSGGHWQPDCGHVAG